MDERYDRNIRIRGFGADGQRALAAARVLVVGAGGLGSPAILYLAAAGVGTLAIADGDTVALSNLQRQILYGTADIGRMKAELACAAVNRLNGDVRTVCLPERLTCARMKRLFADYDCILDCVDSAPTKTLIAELCVRLQKPLVHAGALGMSGQLMSYRPGHACLRCAFPKAEPRPPSSLDAGILGAAAGVLGAMQAAEAVKLISGLGEPALDAVIHINLGSGECLRAAVRRNPRCPVCGREA